MARQWTERQVVRLYLVDLLGHGMAPTMPLGTTLRDMATEVRAHCRSAGLAHRVSIVGHSLGGVVALQWACDHPEDVERVVVLDVTPTLRLEGRSPEIVLRNLLAAPDSTSTRDEMRDALRRSGELPESVVEWLLTNLERAEDGRSMWRFDRKALADFRERLRDVDLWPVVEGGRMRVDCVRGGLSDFVQAEDVARYERAGCTVATIEGAGHNLHVERTSEVVAALIGLFGESLGPR